MQRHTYSAYRLELAASEFWGIHYHCLSAVLAPSGFTQMKHFCVTPAHVPPSAFLLSWILWPIFIHAPPPSCPHTSKSLTRDSAPLSLTCISRCLCLSYQLTLHHWFGIELFWWRMLPHSFADGYMVEDLGWQHLGIAWGGKKTVPRIGFHYYQLHNWLNQTQICLAQILVQQSKEKS